MSVKINSFEIENCKRIKMLTYEPTPTGLTLIGGKNNQGKTSVLDSIAWALGGDRFKPTSAKRDGSYTEPHLRVELSNGIIVERKGKNSSLKVTDINGRLAGQQLLNRFVEQFALDVPRFMDATSKEKAETLLKIIGVGDKLYTLENEEQRVYNERHTIGRIADQKQKFANEMPNYPSMPSEPISASELIAKQQDILAENGENRRKRERLNTLLQEREELRIKIDELTAKLSELESDIEIASMKARDLEDRSTAELEENIRNIEELNRKIRANLDKEKAEEDAKSYLDRYDEMTSQLEDIRRKKSDLLSSAKLPLPQLSVENRELTYKGKKWDSMSGSEQLKVSTAIVRELNPDCGFVLLDKLEQMDGDTLNDFGEWLKEQDLQAIATRVSTGEECSIIIEDGMIKAEDSLRTSKNEWGEF